MFVIAFVNYLYSYFLKYVSYMLTGKFQTDRLEFRFSQYCQFRVPTCLYRKLRNLNFKKIINMLHVMSALRSKISIQDSAED